MYMYMCVTTNTSSLHFIFQEECEESMPKHICMACFNTAVDIQAFVDSAIRFQKNTIYQLFPNSKLEEASDVPLTVPAQQTIQDATTLFPYDVNYVTGETLEKIPSALLALDDGNYKCTTATHEQEKNISMKSDAYNIITELIDSGNYQANKGTPNETIIEISPSCESEQLNEDPNFRNDNEKTPDDINETLLKDTIQVCAKSNGNGDYKNEAGAEETVDELESLPSKKDSKKCPTCGKTFSRQSQLKSHLTSHSETRPFECNICLMKFKYRRNLVEHSSIHDDPPSFICSICGLTFKQRSK